MGAAAAAAAAASAGGSCLGQRSAAGWLHRQPLGSTPLAAHNQSHHASQPPHTPACPYRLPALPACPPVVQVVSKRVANAKSEKFYRAGLGKKKDQSIWMVSVRQTQAGIGIGAAPRRGCRRRAHVSASSPAAPPPCCPFRLEPKTKISLGCKLVIFSGVCFILNFFFSPCWH